MSVTMQVDAGKPQWLLCLAQWGNTSTKSKKQKNGATDHRYLSEA